MNVGHWKKGTVGKWALAATGFIAVFSVAFGLAIYFTAASVMRIEMDATYIKDLKTRVAWLSVGFAVLFLLLGSFCAYAAIRKAARAGVFGASAALTAGVQGESAALATSESMPLENGQLREVLARIGGLTNEVAAASQSLASNTEFCTDMVVGISESIRQIAGGSETIAESSRGNMFMLEEVSKGMEHIAESSQGLANEMSEVAQKASGGMELIERTVAQMQNITEAALASSAAVEQMDRRTLEIDRVTAIMGEIASRINLLSLNAAIEAARAGEFGRGFAVVADEVRKLADQSSSSTKEIARTVEHIRAGSRETREAMSRVLDEVRSGSELAGVAGQSFREIASLTENVSFKVQEVSGVTEEISASAEQILSSVRETVSITEVSLAGTKEIAVCSDEQLAAMEESLQSARQMQEQAQRLRQELDSLAD
ncbi:methyl-accepting chemotaxis protein [Cohnella algarum]|uniref:methyl-accepting chemotaxis protein n=1 Tax=Cohnella algarum TaxID=2044859 RepID=UPI001967142C|nr:methyl-accepting chemotaxis protein [Cohnella algarum]MBN2982504.1 hypothetical protein [Cohnella algarum]